MPNDRLDKILWDLMFSTERVKDRTLKARSQISDYLEDEVSKIIIESNGKPIIKTEDMVKLLSKIRRKS